MFIARIFNFNHCLQKESEMLKDRCQESAERTITGIITVWYRHFSVSHLIHFLDLKPLINHFCMNDEAFPVLFAELF